MILPLISLALLIGALLLTVYFKNIEKNIERQQNEAQSKAINRREDSLKNENDQAAEESENNATENNDISAEEEIDAEEIDAMEKDFDELEDLVNDPVMENLDLDLESF